MLFLLKIWEVICQNARAMPAGRLVHEDLPLAVRVVRDIVNAEIERVRVDSEESFQRLRAFAATFMPDLAPLIELYVDGRPDSRSLRCGGRNPEGPGQQGRAEVGRLRWSSTRPRR